MEPPQSDVRWFGVLVLTASCAQFFAPEAPGSPGTRIEPYAGQMVQQAPRDPCQVPLVAPGLEGRVGPALRRLFLDQLHSRRPVVVLQTEVKERTLQDGLLAPGDPQVGTGLAEIGEHPQEVAGEGVQDLLLYKLRGQVIKDPVAARQLPVVQIAQESGLGGAVQAAVLSQPGQSTVKMNDAFHAPPLTVPSIFANGQSKRESTKMASRLFQF